MFLHDFKKALPPSLLQVIWHPALVLPVTSFWTWFLYIFVCFCCFSCSLRLFILIYCLIGRHCLRIYIWVDVGRCASCMQFYTQIHVRQLRRSTINPAAQLNILDLLQRDTNRKRRRPSVICVRKQYEPWSCLMLSEARKQQASWFFETLWSAEWRDSRPKVLKFTTGGSFGHWRISKVKTESRIKTHKYHHKTLVIKHERFSYVLNIFEYLSCRAGSDRWPRDPKGFTFYVEPMDGGDSCL